MKKNMGSLDRVVRAVLFATALALFFLNVLPQALAIGLLAATGVLLLTSVVSFCPIYAALGMRSCKLDAEGNCT